MSKSSANSKKEPNLLYRVMMAGRESGTRSILFHQAAAEVVGLNATDTRCLDLILRNGPATPSQLAELTGLTTGAVTVLIDRLEKGGFIERKPHEHDRRKTLLVPTPKVQKSCGVLYQSMAQSMAQLMGRYSKKELEFLEVFLNDLSELWKAETAKVMEKKK
jgi:DNA-binding MarR family transcriptional regulator